MKAYLFNYFKTFYSFLLKQSFIKTIYPIFVSATKEQITTKTATMTNATLTDRKLVNRVLKTNPKTGTASDYLCSMFKGIKNYKFSEAQRKVLLTWLDVVDNF